MEKSYNETGLSCVMVITWWTKTTSCTLYTVTSPQGRYGNDFTLITRHVYISVEVCNWKIRRTGKAHFTLLLSGVQPVTILWITTAHVLLSLPCPVHGHLLPLWGGPQLSLCVHSELQISEPWLHSNHIRGRRREVWWREDSTGCYISEELSLGINYNH